MGAYQLFTNGSRRLPVGLEGVVTCLPSAICTPGERRCHSALVHAKKCSIQTPEHRITRLELPPHSANTDRAGKRMVPDGHIQGSVRDPGKFCVGGHGLWIHRRCGTSGAVRSWQLWTMLRGPVSRWLGTGKEIQVFPQGSRLCQEGRDTLQCVVACGVGSYVRAASSIGFLAAPPARFSPPSSGRALPPNFGAPPGVPASCGLSFGVRAA